MLNTILIWLCNITIGLLYLAIAIMIGVAIYMATYTINEKHRVKQKRKKR